MGDILGLKSFTEAKKLKARLNEITSLGGTNHVHDQKTVLDALSDNAGVLNYHDKPIIDPNLIHDVKDSTTNGNILIDDVETQIYAHPETHPATIITEDANHNFVTNTEKANWNDKYTKDEIDNIISIGYVNNIQNGYVRITVNGATFQPIIELYPGSDAIVTWEVEETGTTYTGLTPNINLITAMSRHIKMRATHNNGDDALDDIRVFNVGFNNGEDASGRTISTVPSSYNYGSRQSVTGIENVNNMTRLVYFLAATGTLTGPIDFTGMSELLNIECYGAAVTAVNLKGCISLRRLCLENNLCSIFDLNPVADCLYDLRGSGNGDNPTGQVAFIPITRPMLNLFHWCTQSEVIINHAMGNMLPVIEEWWDWSAQQDGDLVINSSRLTSLMSSGNRWATAALTDCFQNGGTCDLSNNRLTSVTLVRCQGCHDFRFENNLLSTDSVDSILNQINSWNTSGGTINLGGNGNAGPSNLNIINQLTGRGWSVNNNTPSNAAPVITVTPVGGTYPSSQSVTLSANESATIYYTTDGSTPTTSSPVYSTPISISDTTTLRYFGRDTDGNSSSVQSATYTIDSSQQAPTGSILWQDTFDRANAVGYAAVGNDWHSGVTNYTLDIVSNHAILRTGNLGYGVIVSSAGGSLPADYTVTAVIPVDATGSTNNNNRGNYWGIIGRWNSGNGVKAFFTDPNTLLVGPANNYSTGTQISSANFPASWSNNAIEHTISMKMVGTSITVLLDGVEVGTATVDINTTLTGTGIGFCGEAQDRHRDSITVTAN